MVDHVFFARLRYR